METVQALGDSQCSTVSWHFARCKNNFTETYKRLLWYCFSFGSTVCSFYHRTYCLCTKAVDVSILVHLVYFATSNLQKSIILLNIFREPSLQNEVHAVIVLSKAN